MESGSQCCPRVCPPKLELSQHWFTSLGKKHCCLGRCRSTHCSGREEFPNDLWSSAGNILFSDLNKAMTVPSIFLGWYSSEEWSSLCWQDQPAMSQRPGITSPCRPFRTRLWSGWKRQPRQHWVRRACSRVSFSNSIWTEMAILFPGVLSSQWTYSPTCGIWLFHNWQANFPSLLASSLLYWTPTIDPALIMLTQEM